MKGLREKFRKNSGFTLVEMLIVVAIIAILIAVSIPLVGSALEKARDATDQANERAAKAIAAVKYLGVEDGTFKEVTGTFYYDAVNGKLLTANEAKSLKAYGKCTGCNSTDYSNSSSDHSNNIIKAVIEDGNTTGKEKGDITITWAEVPS